MFCTNCGKEIDEGMAFCKYCGKPVYAPANTEKEKNAQSENLNVNFYGEQKEKTQRSMKIPRGRFKAEGFSNGFTSISGDVIVDRFTGVNYLFIQRGYAGGLTVLVDENGKPLVTKEDNIEIDNTEQNKGNKVE